MPFDVSYQARIQVDELDGDEKAALHRLFSEAQPQATKLAPHRPEDGYFVSRLGNKRVLWRRQDTGTPEILSVVDKSYAAA